MASKIKLRLGSSNTRDGIREVIAAFYCTTEANVSLANGDLSREDTDSRVVIGTKYMSTRVLFKRGRFVFCTVEGGE